MSLTFDDYLSLVLNQGVYRQRIKLELLRYSDFSVYREITGDVVKNSGNLTITRKNGIRRSCNFSLINSIIDDVGRYIPDSNNMLGPRQPIRLWLGLADENDEEYFISQGIFFLASPSISSTFSSSITSLELVDPFGLFSGDLGGELNAVHQIPLNTNLYIAINSILSLNNYPLPSILDSKYMSEVNPYTIITEASGKYGDILTELSLIVSANLFFNKDGQLTLSEDTNDNIKGSVFDFTTDNAHYQGGTSKYNYAEFFNSILVVGTNTNSGVIYSGESTDDNLMSPSSVNNIGFKRQKRIENSNLNSNQKCLDLSSYELKKVISKQSEISISSLQLFHLDVDSVITLTDDNLGFNKERFLINSINIPLGSSSPMSLSCVRAIDLPYND